MPYDSKSLTITRQSIGGPRWWRYGTSDPLNAVLAPGYFADGWKRGLQRNNEIEVSHRDGTTTLVVESSTRDSVRVANPQNMGEPFNAR